MTVSDCLRILKALRDGEGMSIGGQFALHSAIQRIIEERKEAKRRAKR